MSNGNGDKKKKGAQGTSGANALGANVKNVTSNVVEGDWDLSDDELIATRIITTSTKGKNLLADLTPAQQQWYHDEYARIKSECVGCTDEQIDTIYENKWQIKTEVETKTREKDEFPPASTLYPNTFKSMWNYMVKKRAKTPYLHGGKLKDIDNPAFFKLRGTDIRSFEEYASVMGDYWTTTYGKSTVKDGKETWAPSTEYLFLNNKKVKRNSEFWRKPLTGKEQIGGKPIGEEWKNKTRYDLALEYQREGKSLGSNSKFKNLEIRKSTSYPLEWRAMMQKRLKQPNFLAGRTLTPTNVAAGGGTTGAWSTSTRRTVSEQGN